MSGALLALPFGLAVGLLLGLVGALNQLVSDRALLPAGRATGVAERLGRLFALLLVAIAVFLVAKNAGAAV